MAGWLSGWVDGCVTGWVAGWVSGWMGGWFGWLVWVGGWRSVGRISEWVNPVDIFSALSMALQYLLNRSHLFDP